MQGGIIPQRECILVGNQEKQSVSGTTYSLTYLGIFFVLNGCKWERDYEKLTPKEAKAEREKTAIASESPNIKWNGANLHRTNRDCVPLCRQHFPQHGNCLIKRVIMITKSSKRGQNISRHRVS